MHGHEWHGFGWHGFSLWWLVPMILFALFFLLMWWRRGPRWCGCGPWSWGDRRPRSGDAAQSLLDERYARGEIDRPQYEEMRQTLGLDRARNGKK